MFLKQTKAVEFLYHGEATIKAKNQVDLTQFIYGER